MTEGIKNLVVITANDGVPHRLALGGRDPAWVSVALSPDGRTLALATGMWAMGQATALSLLMNEPMTVPPSWCTFSMP